MDRRNKVGRGNKKKEVEKGAGGEERSRQEDNGEKEK